MLSECMVGTTKVCIEAEAMLANLKKEELDQLWITRISEYNFIIGFHDGKLREDIKKSKWRQLDKWFCGLEAWRPEMVSFSRTIKICISRLPLQLWSNENLSKISVCWGSMCSRVKPDHLPGDAKKVFVTIETKCMKIEEMVELKFGKAVARIWVSEFFDEGDEKRNLNGQESSNSKMVASERSEGDQTSSNEENGSGNKVEESENSRPAEDNPEEESEPAPKNSRHVGGISEKVGGTMSENSRPVGASSEEANETSLVDNPREAEQTVEDYGTPRRCSTSEPIMDDQHLTLAENCMGKI